MYDARHSIIVSKEKIPIVDKATTASDAVIERKRQQYIASTHRGVR